MSDAPGSLESNWALAELWFFSTGALDLPEARYLSDRYESIPQL
jgi:hypothetical protein